MNKIELNSKKNIINIIRRFISYLFILTMFTADLSIGAFIEKAEASTG